MAGRDSVAKTRFPVLCLCLGCTRFLSPDSLPLVKGTWRETLQRDPHGDVLQSPANSHVIELGSGSPRPSGAAATDGLAEAAQGSLN